MFTALYQFMDYFWCHFCKGFYSET